MNPDSPQNALARRISAEIAAAHRASVTRALADCKLPPFLRVSRLASLLDMHRQRIYELVEMGELDAIRTGQRGMRVSRESVVRWMMKLEG